MSKDPAFLLYPQDFLVGTMTFSHEQVGKYVRILCFQHQSGHLTEEDMMDICGERDAKIWRKFKQDENGLYYNERLEAETIKRRKYTQSRIKNLSKKSHMDSHMENVNENEDVNENKNEIRNYIPAYSEFKEFALTKKPLVDLSHLKSKYDAWVEGGWVDGNGNKIKNWKTKLLNTLPYLKEGAVGRGSRKENYPKVGEREFGVFDKPAAPMPESLRKSISNIGRE